MDIEQVSMDFEEREIYSVQQLNREVKQLLQQNFPLLWVEGELSNVAFPASGHIYFSLKDAQAQVRCAMFRSANRLLPFQPEDGMHVLVRARVGVYEPRGEYQLTIEHMEEAGVGILQRKYEELKHKLKLEGLFDSENKQKLPEFPNVISIVTSASGAAIRDIISVLKRRYPLLSIRIYAVPVQGENSAEAIVDAIHAINKSRASDIVLLARGGGSIEDLWSFNEETVARAIFHSQIPIVTGIGHEVDFTIADFVADLRAPTPSAAAELITPHQDELSESFQQFESTLTYLINDSISVKHQTIDWLYQRLERLHPKQTILRKQEHLNELQRRVYSAVRLNTSELSNLLNELTLKLENQSPKVRIREANMKLIQLQKEIYSLVKTKLQQKQQALQGLTRTLDAFSPLGTLSRGYAIASNENTGQILRDSRQIAINDEISVQLAKGQLTARVEKKSTEKSKS